MRVSRRAGARVIWVFATLSSCGIGLSAAAVRDRVAARLEPHHVSTLSTVKDPERFVSELTYELPRAVVPLTRDDAVVTELRLRSRTLTEAEVAQVARVLVEEARRLRQDPLLFLAVIHVESFYNHLAVSYVGAEGLMQLMPPTARWMAEQEGEEWRDQHSFDPLFNVRMGSRYLVLLWEQYGQRMDLALTAYNRGPHNTSHILRRNGGKKLPGPILDFYAGKVLERYEQLLAAYGRLPLN